MIIDQDSYHCLIPDLPEHRLSTARGPFTIADTAHRIAELIREHMADVPMCSGYLKGPS